MFILATVLVLWVMPGVIYMLTDFHGHADVYMTLLVFLYTILSQSLSPHFLIVIISLVYLAYSSLSCFTDWLLCQGMHMCPAMFSATIIMAFLISIVSLYPSGRW